MEAARAEIEKSSTDAAREIAEAVRETHTQYAPEVQSTVRKSPGEWLKDDLRYISWTDFGAALLLFFVYFYLRSMLFGQRKPTALERLLDEVRLAKEKERLSPTVLQCEATIGPKERARIKAEWDAANGKAGTIVLPVGVIHPGDKIHVRARGNMTKLDVHEISLVGGPVLFSSGANIVDGNTIGRCVSCGHKRAHFERFCYGECEACVAGKPREKGSLIVTRTGPGGDRASYGIELDNEEAKGKLEEIKAMLQKLPPPDPPARKPFFTMTREESQYWLRQAFLNTPVLRGIKEDLGYGPGIMEKLYPYFKDGKLTITREEARRILGFDPDDAIEPDAQDRTLGLGGKKS